MSRRLLTLALLALAGCTPAFEEAVHNVIPPEQRSVDYRDPSQLPPVRVPPTVPPRTVSDRRPGAREWQLSLDDAVRIGLENAKVIRVLAGVTAVSSGQTIYDPAISNTLIDQAQARFDPVFFSRNTLISRRT